MLRPYQDQFVTDIRAAFSRVKSVLGICPTGAGKTRIAAYLAKRAQDRGNRVIFTCHRDFLIEQTSEAFHEAGIEHTFIAAGERYNPSSRIAIASIDTLKRRLPIIPTPHLLIVDEAVHSAAAGWASVIENFQERGSYSLGLTACSERLSGQGLRSWFKELVLGPTTAELIELGYLSKYKAFAPDGVDLSGLHTRGGDYIKGEVEERMDKPSIIGNAVKEYVKIGLGRRALMYCCSLKHSHHTAEAFRFAGFKAAHIGSDTDKDTRRQMLQDFRTGALDVLTSVDIFNEGLNVPAAGYAGLLRPTKSLSIYLQQVGRVLRPDPDKPYAIIADHANNIQHYNGEPHHGMPCEEREWTLESRAKRSGSSGEKTIPTRVCEKCYYVHKPLPCCPACGFVYPVQARVIKEIEGNLREIEAVARKNKRMEQGMAKTAEELIGVFLGRGMSARKAKIQAAIILNARKKKENKHV